jgi:mannose-6-phosphate isomerase-like protein (cupin superfamily)
MKVVSPETARHYIWGSGSDGWVLLPDAGMTIIQERMPPATAEVRHYHEKARQFFYVLSGELRMEMDGDIHLIPAGHGLEIPPGACHQARNDSTNDVSFLVISSPTTHDDRTDCPVPETIFNSAD